MTLRQKNKMLLSTSIYNPKFVSTLELCLLVSFFNVEKKPRFYDPETKNWNVVVNRHKYDTECFDTGTFETLDDPYCG